MAFDQNGCKLPEIYQGLRVEFTEIPCGTATEAIDLAKQDLHAILQKIQFKLFPFVDRVNDIRYCLDFLEGKKIIFNNLTGDHIKQDSMPHQISLCLAKYLCFISDRKGTDAAARVNLVNTLLDWLSKIPGDRSIPSVMTHIWQLLQLRNRAYSDLRPIQPDSEENKSNIRKYIAIKRIPNMAAKGGVWYFQAGGRLKAPGFGAEFAHYRTLEEMTSNDFAEFIELALQAVIDQGYLASWYYELDVGDPREVPAENDLPPSTPKRRRTDGADDEPLYTPARINYPQIAATPLLPLERLSELGGTLDFPDNADEFITDVGTAGDSFDLTDHGYCPLVIDDPLPVGAVGVNSPPSAIRDTELQHVPSMGLSEHQEVIPSRTVFMPSGSQDSITGNASSRTPIRGNSQVAEVIDSFLPSPPDVGFITFKPLFNCGFVPGKGGICDSVKIDCLVNGSSNNAITFYGDAAMYFRFIDPSCSFQVKLERCSDVAPVRVKYQREMFKVIEARVMIKHYCFKMDSNGRWLTDRLLLETWYIRPGNTEDISPLTSLADFQLLLNRHGAPSDRYCSVAGIVISHLRPGANFYDSKGHVSLNVQIVDLSMKNLSLVQMKMCGSRYSGLKEYSLQIWLKGSDVRLLPFLPIGTVIRARFVKPQAAPSGHPAFNLWSDPGYRGEQEIEIYPDPDVVHEDLEDLSEWGRNLIEHQSILHESHPLNSDFSRLMYGIDAVVQVLSTNEATSTIRVQDAYCRELVTLAARPKQSETRRFLFYHLRPGKWLLLRRLTQHRTNGRSWLKVCVDDVTEIPEWSKDVQDAMRLMGLVSY